MHTVVTADELQSIKDRCSEDFLKPYRCEVCYIRYTTKIHLVNNVKYKHSIMSNEVQSAKQ